MLTLPFRNFIKNVANRTLQANISIRNKSKTIHPSQEAVLNEKLFLVDKDDKVIGQATKKECHEVTKDGCVPLHRAFSVFLFNKKGDLLLQKRSAEKITYPNCYSNSCCSHPVADYPGEEVEENALGIKKAAQRRLNFELGIPVDKIPIEKLDYITRVHYKDTGNGQWGEHEIDYVLFFQDDVTVDPNPNEISEISFIPRSELDEYLPTLSGALTPWFNLILKHRLRLWWDNLDELDKFRDHQNILELNNK